MPKRTFNSKLHNLALVHAAPSVPKTGSHSQFLFSSSTCLLRWVVSLQTSRKRTPLCLGKHEHPTVNAMTLGFPMDSCQVCMLLLNNVLWFTGWIPSLHWEKTSEGLGYKTVKHDGRKAEDLREGPLSGEVRFKVKAEQREKTPTKPDQIYTHSILADATQSVSFLNRGVWIVNAGCAAW